MLTEKKLWITAVSVCGMLLSVSAENEGINLGAFTFHPFVAGEISYDDNVFQTKDGQDDIYTELAVGARLKRDTDTLHVDSSAWFARRFYDQYTERDANRWGLAGLLRGESDKAFGMLLLDARQVDDYNQAPTLGSIPTGFEGTVDLAFDRTAGNEPRRIFDGMVGGGYTFSDTLALMAGYKSYAVDYYDDATTLESWREDTVGTELSVELTDKMVSFINGQFGVQSGDGAPFGESAELITGRIGVKNTLTDKSTLRLALGATRYATDADTYTEPSFELNALWQATSRITVFVNGRNEVQPVGDGANTQLSSRGSTGVNYVLNRVVTMVLSGSAVHDRYLNSTLLPGGSTGKPTTTLFIGTYRLTVQPIKRWDVYGQVEFTDAQQDLADDYQRLRATLGTSYAF